MKILECIAIVAFIFTAAMIFFSPITIPIVLFTWFNVSGAVAILSGFTALSLVIAIVGLWMAALS